MGRIEQWARRFWSTRKTNEKHKLTKYYVWGPLSTLVQVTLTGMIGNYYYMDQNKLILYSVDVHKEASAKDPVFHSKTIAAARNIAHIKDQVIIGLAVENALPEKIREKISTAYTDVLMTLPPNLIHRLVEIMRKTGKPLIGRGLGTWAKKKINATIESWSTGMLEHYAVKYLRQLRDIIRLTHPKTSDDLRNKIYRWIAYGGKTEAPTDTLKAYSEFMEMVGTGRYGKALETAVEHSFPFEIVRSNIPASKLAENPALASEAVNKLITPTQLYLNIRYLMRFMDKSSISSLILRMAGRGRSSAWDIARAYLAVKDEEIREALNKAYSKATANIQLPGLPEISSVIVYDLSGSMENLYAKAVAMSLPLAETAVAFVGFSNGAHEVPFKPNDLGSIEKIRSWAYMIGLFRGTDLGAGVKLGAELAKAHGAKAVYVFTDEQENLSFYGQAVDIIRSNRNINFVVVNATPYPTHAVPLKDENLITLPACTPETLIASYRLMQLKEAGEEEAKEYVEKIAETAKSKH